MTGNTLAAELAPHVDRLVIAVHVRLRERRDELHRLMEQCGVPSLALLIDLRPFLLVSNLVPTDLVAAFLRFVDDERASEITEQLAATAALVPSQAGFAASEGACRIAESLTAMQAEVMTAAWAGRPEVTAGATTICRQVTGAVDPSRKLTIFFALQAVPEPGMSAEYLLHHQPTMLRYLRSDAHVAVVTEYGLTLSEARLVDRAWRGALSPGEAAPYPGLHSWIDVEAGVLTDVGEQRRIAIEDETDHFMGTVLDRVPSSAELPALLAQLPD